MVFKEAADKYWHLTHNPTEKLRERNKWWDYELNVSSKENVVPQKEEHLYELKLIQKIFQQIQGWDQQEEVKDKKDSMRSEFLSSNRD